MDMFEKKRSNLCEKSNLFIKQIFRYANSYVNRYVVGNVSILL